MKSRKSLLTIEQDLYCPNLLRQLVDILEFGRVGGLLLWKTDNPPELWQNEILLAYIAQQLTDLHLASSLSWEQRSFDR